MTKEIRFTDCDGVALVSDEDYEYLARFRWHLAGGPYPCASLDGTANVKRMHQVVVKRCLGEIPDGFEVDHVDRDKLNNTRENLRLCTHAQNMANMIRGGSKFSQHGYKGVHPSGRGWTARIGGGKNSHYVGQFNTEIAAAAAYNRAAREIYGEFAILNPVPDDAQDTPLPSLGPQFRVKRSKANSAYRGVSRNGKKWVAQMARNGHREYLGIYATEEEAARAYDRRAYELFGDAAPLNFPHEAL